MFVVGLVTVASIHENTQMLMKTNSTIIDVE